MNSIPKYYTKLKPLWDELQAFNLVPKCTCGSVCGAAKSYIVAQEIEKTHQFLMGLNENFAMIESQIRILENFKSINHGC